MTWLDDITMNTVIVHLADGGPSVKGIKAAVHDDCLVLRDALVLNEENDAVLVGGELVVPRDQVLFIQTLPADAA